MASSVHTGTSDRLLAERDRERFQFGVVVFVLTLALGWIVVYSVMTDSRGRKPHLPPGLAARLEHQHEVEYRSLTEQRLEIYGGMEPAMAGS